MATIPKQSISIKDLPTKSVTLYPSRAHITREINDVLLKPGLNEIEIWGLTPTTDEYSIQIDGRGSATITDMTVDLVPNRERYEDAYPEDDIDESEASETEDEGDSDDDLDTLKALKTELKSLEAQKISAEESKAAAIRRQDILDRYSNTAEAKETKPEDLAKILTVYSKQRQEAHCQHAEALTLLEELEKKIAKKQKAIWNAGKEERKRKEKAEKDKAKEKLKQKRLRLEKLAERRRLREERLKFWPKMVYRVTVTLETAIDTPGSSRRNSIDSVTLAGNSTAVVPAGKPGESSDKALTYSGAETLVSLSLSYITSSASWSPCYDITLSSVSGVGTIVYRAEFKNQTSETWSDAKVALSTSLTAYSGLDDTVPFMRPWRVRIGKGYNSETNGLLSNDEVSKSSYTAKQMHAQNANLQRSDLFGSNDGVVPQMKMAKRKQDAPIPQQQYQQQQVRFMPSQVYDDSSLTNVQSQTFGAHGGGYSSFGAQAPGAPPPPPPAQAAWSLGAAAVAPSAAPSRSAAGGRGGRGRFEEFARVAHRSRGASESEEEELDEAISAMADATSTMDFEESTWEDNGLTTSYDVPGSRTIGPSSTARRHKIATLHIAKAHMSYIAVPKLRAAAFLRAKVRNPSPSITLLKGQAGVTLDGSFLGTMTLPRVSPSQLFTLPLGVDPAIQVSYSKPTVHRATLGVFSKESAQSYARSIWLTNTKTVPVELLVLDQVPVSEDERLRFETAVPKGLSRIGDKVRAGEPAKETQKAWGRAVASLKKDGEISWEVTLEKSGAVVLKLEYDGRLPSGDCILTV